MVTLGGIFLLIAAALVIRVQDITDRNIPEADVIRGDEAEPILVQESAQPVPSRV